MKYKIVSVTSDFFDIRSQFNYENYPILELVISDGTHNIPIKLCIYALCLVRVGWSFTGTTIDEYKIGDVVFDSRTVFDGWWDCNRKDGLLTEWKEV